MSQKVPKTEWQDTKRQEIEKKDTEKHRYREACQLKDKLGERKRDKMTERQKDRKTERQNNR